MTTGHVEQSSETITGGQIKAGIETVNELEVMVEEETVIEKATTEGEAVNVSNMQDDKHKSKCTVLGDF